jgi:hypothetical protein
MKSNNNSFNKDYVILHERGEWKYKPNADPPASMNLISIFTEIGALFTTIKWNGKLSFSKFCRILCGFRPNFSGFYKTRIYFVFRSFGPFPDKVKFF